MENLDLYSRVPCDPDTGEIPIQLVRISSLVDGEPGFLRAGSMNGLFNYNTEKASLESGIDGQAEPSMTQQQFREEADINTIVRRFGLTGQLPENPRLPTYGDFTEVTDYQTALNAVRLADESFMALPAPIRAEFDNDPQKLLLALDDERNADRLRELGLLNPKAELTPQPLPTGGASTAPKDQSST